MPHPESQSTSRHDTSLPSVYCIKSIQHTVIQLFPTIRTDYYHCFSKLPQPLQLKTRQIYYLIVTQVRTSNLTGLKLRGLPVCVSFGRLEERIHFPAFPALQSCRYSLARDLFPPPSKPRLYRLNRAPFLISLTLVITLSRPDNPG